MSFSHKQTFQPPQDINFVQPFHKNYGNRVCSMKFSTFKILYGRGV